VKGVAGPLTGYKLAKNNDQPGIKAISYVSLNRGSLQEIDGSVVDESLVCISVNGKEIAAFMCSPIRLEALAIGFLYSEGIISEYDQIRSIHISRGKSCVDVWLRDESFEMPKRGIVTAGCGGGVTFDDLSKEHAPLASKLTVSSDLLANLMMKLHKGAGLYQQARGIHTAVLAKGSSVLLQVEDIGRHNCIDKLAGEALLQGIHANGCIVLSSGRISSEMINKARRLGTPIICSRTSPTSLSVALAEAWNMTIVAYLRQRRMRIYTHPERIETS